MDMSKMDAAEEDGARAHTIGRCAVARVTGELIRGAWAVPGGCAAAGRRRAVYDVMITSAPALRSALEPEKNPER